MKDLEQGIADEEAASRQAGEAKADATGIEGGADVNALLFRLPGQAGLVIGAPGGDGPKLSGGELTTGSAWSTIKVPIAERVLADFGGPGGISATQSEQMLRDAGDGETAISTQGRDGFSTQGQTRWSLVQQNRYMAAVADGGTFETGQQILSRIAKWTTFRLADQVGPPQPCG